MDHPTLAELLTARPLLDSGRPGSSSFIAAGQFYWEHLLNIHRATAADLTPLRIFEHGARLQSILDTKPLTAAQHEALTQLCEALEAGRHDAWGQHVLSLLGPNADESLTSYRRSVLVHVFRHGEPPATDWCDTGDELVVELLEAGLVDDDGASLEFTDAGLSVAGVLVPRCTRISPGQWVTTGADALTVVTNTRTDGSTAVVKLVEAPGL